MELHDVLKSIASTKDKFAYFTETVTASFLDKPLVTKGTLEFKAPATMIKHLLEPDKIEQRIEDDMLSISDNKKEDNTISLSSSPELAAGINAIRWILSGNESALDHNFNITFNNVVYQWTVKLIPKDDEVSAVISSIVVSGEKERIKQIKITHVGGDVITTDLYEHK
jgi:hypothetical protein